MKKYYKIIDDKYVFFEGNVLQTEDSVILNPSEEQLLEDGWQIYEEPEPTEEEILTSEKNTKLQELDLYDKSLEKFTISNSEMWLDHELRQQLKTSIEAYLSVGNDTVTKWFNGNSFTFSCSQWLQMLTYLEIYASEVLNTTEMHKTQISQIDNLQDLRDYDYTQGYPEMLNF